MPMNVSILVATIAVAVGGAVERVGRTLQDVEHDFPDGVLVAERLLPLLGGVASHWSAMSRLTWPVSVDLNGKAGVHQTSGRHAVAERPERLHATDGKSSARPTVMALGL